MYYLYKGPFGVAERGFDLSFKSFKDIFFYSLSSCQLLSESLKSKNLYYNKDFNTLLDLRISFFNDGSYKIFPISKYRVKIEKNVTCCPYCQRRFDSRDSFEQDHIMPKSRGGSDDVENTILICPECNNSKLNHDLFYWFYSIRKQFPPLDICNYYLMLIYWYCERNDLWSIPFIELVQNWHDKRLPFAPHYLPLTYPQPAEIINNDYSLTLL